MNNRQQPQSEARRAFLRKATAGVTTATLAAALPGAALTAPEEAERPEASKGYRLTQHVLDYYKSVSD